MLRNLVKQHRHYWEDAGHLLQLAKEYEERMEAAEPRRRQYFEYWRFRLIRMSFIARMLAVEALLNNALEAYGNDDAYDLLPSLDRSFPRREQFPRITRKRPGRPFAVSLKWKLYLTPYICGDAGRMERDQYYQYDDGPYLKFKQLIIIRNDFVHARLLEDKKERPVDLYLRSGRPRPIQEITFDPDYSRFQPSLGLSSDPICFNLADAEVCRRSIWETIENLDDFLGGRILTSEFWDSDLFPFA